MILIHLNVSKFFKKQQTNLLYLQIEVVWMRVVTVWIYGSISSPLENEV